MIFHIIGCQGNTDPSDKEIPLAPTRMATLCNTDNTKCWWEGETRELLFAVAGNAGGYSHFGRHMFRHMSKLNIFLPHYPAVTFCGIYPKEVKSYGHTKPCIWMFIAVLYLITKTWKQPGCPSVGKLINKLWYIQTMEYDSSLKRNELSSHEKTLRKFKRI